MSRFDYAEPTPCAGSICGERSPRPDSLISPNKKVNNYCFLFWNCYTLINDGGEAAGDDSSPAEESGVDLAYCPYCGKPIKVRGQACCPHCSADIIDIWKLLDSNLQPPSPVRPAPGSPRRLDWVGPALILLLGLLLFALSLYLALPWLIELVTRLKPHSSAGWTALVISLSPGADGMIWGVGGLRAFFHC